MTDEIDIVSETQTDIDTFSILPHDLTDHTARWYFERFFGLDEEYYYLLECASREPEKSDEIVRLCQYIVDERTNKFLETFGKNEPKEDGGFYISIKEIDYGSESNRDLS